MPNRLQPRKRGRRLEAESSPVHNSTERPPKRLRKSVSDDIDEGSLSQELGSKTWRQTDPIDYWRREGRWPKEYFDQEYGMSHLLARKKSTASFRRKRSDAGSTAPSSTTPSDQKPREEKSTPYEDARYETLLATKGSFMDEHQAGITDKSRNTCRTLLETQQVVPEDTLFRDDLFQDTCKRIRNRNEARVIRDISLFIVPSAETLTIRGAGHLQVLIESVNEGWNNAIPVTRPRPQPDYSVGFKREAFTEDQLNRLQPFVGELSDTSFFMSTYYMYFPFFTCEVKCGAAALDIADRQNAHSMTLAVRGIVELFRLVKRENELQREILAFSVSHDHRSVRLYGHYPVIEDKKTTYYRHPIHTFDFTALDGKEKWTAYMFTKNVYDVWMPTHFTRLCSVIDSLPADLDFELPQLSESQFPEASGLSQGLQSHHLSESNKDSASLVTEDHSALSLLGSQGVTPDTSFTQGTGQTSFKRPKRRHGA